MHVSDGRVAPRCRTVIGEPNQVMSVAKGLAWFVPGRLSELQQPMAELIPPNRTPPNRYRKGEGPSPTWVYRHRGEKKGYVLSTWGMSRSGRVFWATYLLC